jgi:hypothetical protein
MMLLDAIPPKERFAAALRINRALFSTYAGLTPDPWQKRLLLSNHKRVLLNCSRQSGKSQTLGTLAAHTGLYNCNALVLMLSRRQRQSSELFRKCLDVYRALGRPVPAESESVLSLQLENGSRIVSLPGGEDGLRGFSSVHTLIIDEASRVPDDLYFSVLPMLAVSNGRLLSASTPFGNRGWWWDSCEEAKSPTTAHLWDYYEVPATDCPRISPEFLAEMRHKMGNWWFSQEYMCQFLDAQSAAFKQAEIDAAYEEQYDTWNIRDYLQTWREGEAS